MGFTHTATHFGCLETWNVLFAPFTVNVIAADLRDQASPPFAIPTMESTDPDNRRTAFFGGLPSPISPIKKQTALSDDLAPIPFAFGKRKVVSSVKKG